MTEHETREDLEAYALGALDEGDRARTDRHVAGCASCRSTVEAYEALLARLPGALAVAAPSAPDPAVLRRVLRVASRRPLWPRVAGIAFAAAAFVLIAVGVWNISLTQTIAHERDVYRRLAGQQEIVFEVIDSPKASRLVLRSPVSGSTAYGKVFVRSDLPFVVAMVGNLPPPPAGQAYHLWLTLDSGETVLAGTFTVDEGFGSVVYQAGRNGPVFQSVRVTSQPTGGSTPEGVPVVFWSR
jgi:hypothetical protein